MIKQINYKREIKRQTARNDTGDRLTFFTDVKYNYKQI